MQSCNCNVDGPQQLDKIFGSNHDQSDAELDLVNEIGFIILDTIEQIIQVNNKLIWKSLKYIYV